MIWICRSETLLDDREILVLRERSIVVRIGIGELFRSQFEWRDFATTGNTPARKVPVVNARTMVRRDIMGDLSRFRFAIRNSAGESEFPRPRVVDPERC